MKPILFNTEMVQAIFDGRKTQTRRPIKSPTGYFHVCWQKINPKNQFIYQGDENGMMLDKYVNAPYKVGDILYVRETWQESECFDYSIKGKYVFRAIEAHEEFAEDYNIRWRPSIHMPREAARIFLKVTNVRVEQLQDVTQSDAYKEGIRNLEQRYPEYTDIDYDFEADVINRLRLLWDGIYAKKGYGWENNPWVWVIEFERVEKGKD